MKNFLILAALLLATGLSLAACNTVDGIGQDLSSASRGVRDQL